MNAFRRCTLALAALCAFGLPLTMSAPSPTAAEALTRADKLLKQGNSKEAYDMVAPFLQSADKGGTPVEMGKLLQLGLNALGSLGNQGSQFEEFIQQATTTHAENWHVLSIAAQWLASSGGNGTMVDGKFRRWDWDGPRADSSARDRVQAQRWMQKATELALQDADASASQRSQLLLSSASMWLNARQAWQLQDLTDLTALPEVEMVEGGRGGRGFGRRMPWMAQDDTGYPVNANGEPVYFKIPENWDAAANDGERWRFLLNRAAQTNPANAQNIQLQFARQLQSWLDVTTLQNSPIWPLLSAKMDERADDAGQVKQSVIDLPSLAENETITRLATGVKRHTLPAGYAYLEIFKELSTANTETAAAALQARAQIFENRRQLVTAAATWKELRDRFPNQSNGHWRQTAETHLQQIEGKLGKLEASEPQPAGRPASIDLVFRNASSVKFTARPVKVDALLAAIKTELKARSQGQKPREQEDWNWFQQSFSQLIQGTLRIQNNEISKFLGDVSATWEEVLQPAEGHRDRRVHLKTPLEKAGVYLVEAEFGDGLKAHCLVEITDLVVFTKPSLSAQTHHGFVMDAVSGKTVENAEVFMFGYRQEYRDRNNRPQQQWFVQEKTSRSDKNGSFEITGDQQQRWQWLTHVKAADGRTAVLGFGTFYNYFRDTGLPEAQQRKLYIVTDRPVYRPDQKVHLSGWARQASYAEGNRGNIYAGQRFTCRVHDPRGQQILQTDVEADSYGAMTAELDLPANATLGVYRVSFSLPSQLAGNSSFRVEEYKKPEFEVVVKTPEKPVLLGEAFEATVEAKYYFGGAVTDAKVHYKVERTRHDAQWFPARPWDWLYGPGYWWRNSDYDWLPGHRSCIRIWPPWWPRQTDPPEVVAEATVPIGADGTVKIPIDSALAKELHGDQDHKYQITAEVVDSSRRMIVGSGSVIAPRQPYQVYVWTDRGYYEAGAKSTVQVSARTPDGKPVNGKATLRVLAVTYQENQTPQETEEAKYELTVKDGQQATQVISFPKTGQYRLDVAFDDEAGHVVNGTAHTSVRGPDFNGKGYRFPALEVVASKPEFAPGEEASFMVNTDQEGGTVLIFERPRNGSYPKPKVVRIAEGKSTSFTLPVGSNDQPNFFVEVVTVQGAKLHTQVVQVPVPPTKRIADVQINPSKDTFKPQEDGSVKIRVTQPDGSPIKGRVLLTGYDKSLEYISGGSNVGSVRDFFWGWKRHHRTTGSSSLQTVHRSVAQQGVQWQPIGIFGNDDVSIATGGGFGVGMGGMAPRGAMMTRTLSASAAPAAPAAALADGAVLETAKRKNGAEMNESEGAPPAEAEAQVRQEFADLLVWNSTAETDAEGNVTLPVHFPDDLTTWKLRAWVLGPNTEVGEAQVEVITRKDLLVRLQAPRFFVEKDEVVLSGIVHNDHKDAQKVRAVLELDGKTLRLADGQPAEQHFEIPAGGEHRFDWKALALAEGEATVRVKALAAAESDAMEKKYPVFVHGMERQDAWSLAIRTDQANGAIKFNVPEKRRPAQTRLEVRYSPSLAAAMVDALPFLVSYPHGCTEQTLNRFVPTVITQQTLRDLGLNLTDIRNKRANLNAQELGDPALRAKQWQRFQHEPVFDEAEVRKMAAAGVERLQAMQAADGGWGWWPGAAEGSVHLTAQVVEGLLLAKAAGADVPQGMLNPGTQWLQRREAEQLRKLKLPEKHRDFKRQPDNYDALVHGVLVKAGSGDAEMRQRLFDGRLVLSKSMQARLGVACAAKGETERRDMIVRNLEQFQHIDAENQTAWLDFGGENAWWYWQNDEIETMAAYLQLRLAKDGQDPIAPQLVKYLLNNRKHGSYWRSTRDTAAAVTALAAYIKASGESDPDMLISISLDGKVIKEVPINKDNLFTYDHSLVLTGAEVPTGDHELKIERKGKGPLYANVYLTCFTLEDHLRAAGLEVKVERNLYKLIPEETKDLVSGAHGQALKQKGARYRREPLPADAQVVSGDLIEVELITDSKNDYEYLMLEDFKPAGCEAVDLQSGYVWNQGISFYREFRDARVTYYLERLPRGRHSMTYRLRAEIPGKFSALPSVISGMYAPELKGNAEERKVAISDAQ